MGKQIGKRLRMQFSAFSYHFMVFIFVQPNIIRSVRMQKLKIQMTENFREQNCIP